ncbi:GntR family transcriptional regulator [Oryzibacter oryziterrae]|uniref:GntR family transcriptional regulator n=1 Tax=Oryzibacter oryziterrae TaxID=2766474 RepID=UPI001F1C172A|nr:GntR family transcriptional regulator [Oryzibacter oryziterrae]
MPAETYTADPASLTQDRVARIRNGLMTAILEHRLLPGTRLREDEVGQIYDASRTLVRAALQQLAHEGIVDIEKNRGAFVSSPTPREARETFEARRLIEAAIVERAIAARTDVWLSRLDEHLQQEHDAEARGDHRAAIRLSGEFHLAVADMAGQSIYGNILSELVARTSLIILLYRRHRGHHCGPDHHRMITDAIRAGNVDAARTLMVDHLAEIEAELDLTEAEEPAVSLAQILTS